MTFPDKLSDAGKEQLAKQIDYFQAFSTRAFEHAERIVALNLQTTRAALDQTAGAVRKLAEVRDPRDLMAFTSQTQTQVAAAMAYSRKLFEIANQPPAAPATTESAPAPAPSAAAAAAPDDHIVTAAPVMVSEPVAEAAPAPVAATLDEPAEPAAAPPLSAAAILPGKHPLGEAEPEDEPERAPVLGARARPIARAASKVAAAPVDTPHLAASPLPEAGPVAMPAIAPVDAVAAPVEAGAPPQPKRGGGSASKGSRKR
jgi:phasin family protein